MFKIGIYAQYSFTHNFNIIINTINNDLDLSKIKFNRYPNVFICNNKLFWGITLMTDKNGLDLIKAKNFIGYKLICLET